MILNVADEYEEDLHRVSSASGGSSSSPGKKLQMATRGDDDNAAQVREFNAHGEVRRPDDNLNKDRPDPEDDAVGDGIEAF